jgi:Flp pilus assembly pilin Flp
MSTLRRFLKALHFEDRGQDLAEYCLLTALVALVGLGILVRLSGGMQALWSGANISLTAGSAAAAAAPAAAAAAAAATPASAQSH